jgi:hypothetical protein
MGQLPRRGAPMIGRDDDNRPATVGHIRRLFAERETRDREERRRTPFGDQEWPDGNFHHAYGRWVQRQQNRRRRP